MKKGKEKILDAALDCFAKYGFHGVSMDEIVKQAGVSKGLVYYHFKSKDEVLIEIIKKRLEHFNIVADLMEKDKTANEKLKILLDNLKIELTEYSDLNRLMVCIFLQQDVTPLVKDAMINLEPDFQRLFNEEKKMLSELGHKIDDVSFLTFRATLQGVAQIYLLNPEIFPLDGVLDNIYNIYKK